MNQIRELTKSVLTMLSMTIKDIRELTKSFPKECTFFTMPCMTIKGTNFQSLAQIAQFLSDNTPIHITHYVIKSVQSRGTFSHLRFVNYCLFLLGKFRQSFVLDQDAIKRRNTNNCIGTDRF